MQTKIKAMLDKPMDRREFLRYMGLCLLAILGISALLKLFSGDNELAPQASGYGSSAYGGSAEGIT